MAALGGGLVYRAATGHCHLYEALGIDTAADRGAPAGASEDAPEAVAAITSGKPAEELVRLWRDPQTLTRITSGLAEVTPAGDGRMHWKVRGPLGRDFEWDTRVVEDRPGSGQRWQSVEGATLPSEGEVHFRPAPRDWGTEVTLRIRFDPPGGAFRLAAANYRQQQGAHQGLRLRQARRELFRHRRRLRKQVRLLLFQTHRSHPSLTDSLLEG